MLFSSRSIRLLESAPPRPVVIAATDPIERTPDRVFRELLRAIISQARLDGMTSVRMYITDGAPNMDYFGPADAAEPRWWYMVPPPLESWNGMFRALVSRTRFGAEPGVGQLACEVGRRKFRVTVMLHEAPQFTLRWSLK